MEIRQLFHLKIFPFFNADATVWGWTDPDITQPQIVELILKEKQITFSKEELEAIQRGFGYDPIGKKAITSARPVIALGIDLDREERENEIFRFEKEEPEYFKVHPKLLLSGVKTAMVTLDKPDITMGWGIHRFEEKNWTLREVRLMELLRPHLFQSVKCIALKEELDKFQSIADALSHSSTPISVIGKDGRIYFMNTVFSDLFNLEEGQLLPFEILELIQKEINRNEISCEEWNGTIKMPFLNLDQGFFRVVLSPIAQTTRIPEQRWLLKLKSPDDPYSQMNLKMQKAKLTPRETEVACLIKDGMTDDQIAERLFISPHTVREHIKKIFKKFDINNRLQLLSCLES